MNPVAHELFENEVLIVITKILNDEEFVRFTDIYKNGFHVYFQQGCIAEQQARRGTRPIAGGSNDKLYRTAEYIATGYFHNSQIQEINHEKRTITFKYKKMVERGSGTKHFSCKTMGIFEFMTSPNCFTTYLKRIVKCSDIKAYTNIMCRKKLIRSKKTVGQKLLCILSKSNRKNALSVISK